jgi:hypothetical protein
MSNIRKPWLDDDDGESVKEVGAVKRCELTEDNRNKSTLSKCQRRSRESNVEMSSRVLRRSKATRMVELINLHCLSDDIGCGAIG